MSRATGFLLLLLLFSPIPASAQDGGVDVSLFRSINALQNPHRSGALEYLDLTSMPTFVALPVGFMVVGSVLRDGSTANAGILTAVSQLSALGLTAALKELVGRKRPFEALEGVRVKHQWSALGASFPSGHAAQAFAIATILSLHYSKISLTIPVFLWASAIGYTRIYLGLHYPSDVLAGAVLGVAAAAAVWSVRAHLYPLGTSLAGEPEARVAPLGLPNLEIVQLKIPL